MATTDIATAEEIDRRVEAADTARRAKRSAAAKEVGELAQRRTVLAEQLAEVERQLGEVLADASRPVPTTRRGLLRRAEDRPRRRHRRTARRPCRASPPYLAPTP